MFGDLFQPLLSPLSECVVRLQQLQLALTNTLQQALSVLDVVTCQPVIAVFALAVTVVFYKPHVGCRADRAVVASVECVCAAIQRLVTAYTRFALISGSDVRIKRRLSLSEQLWAGLHGVQLALGLFLVCLFDCLTGNFHGAGWATHLLQWPHGRERHAAGFAFLTRQGLPHFQRTTLRAM